MCRPAAPSPIYIVCSSIWSCIVRTDVCSTPPCLPFFLVSASYTAVRCSAPPFWSSEESNSASREPLFSSFCWAFALGFRRRRDGRTSIASISDASAAFIRLIDHAIAQNGSYFLTYHRFARRDQVLTCHPALRLWLAAKLRFDPGELFQSDWYRHLVHVVGDRAP